MSIARRSFLKSATMSALSAGLAIGGAQLIFGQQPKGRETLPTKPVAPTGQLGRPDVIGDGDFPIPIEAYEDALFYFRPSTFTPYVGDIFQAPNALGQMIELKLTRVSEYKMKEVTKISTKKTRQPKSFSIAFTSSQPLPPFTSIQKMSHPALGQFDLFLTSHQAQDGTFVYEAVFNHLQ